MIEAIDNLPEKLQEMQNAFIANKPALNKDYKAIILFCADARVPVGAVSDGSLLALENAGNLYDVQPGGFPLDIKNVFVIGHRTSPGIGCGACAASLHLGEMTDDEISAMKNGYPELYSIAQMAEKTPENNLLNVVEQLIKARYNVGYGMIDNVDLKITDIKLRSPGLEGVRDMILSANEHYRRVVHAGTMRKYTRKFLESTQTPEIACINKMNLALAEVLGGRYMESNTIFESKQPNFLPGITDICKATGQYHQTHFGGHDSFKDSGLTIISANSEDDLSSMIRCYIGDQAISEYMEKGGKTFGMVVNKDGMKFYNIRI